MESLITKDMEHCYICKGQAECIHHIFYGTANRKNSDKYKLVVPLCNKHHNMSNNSVHFNREMDITVKKIAQRKFEEIHGHEEFIKIFGKNYL